jgi:hypothetical protein
MQLVALTRDLSIHGVRREINLAGPENDPPLLCGFGNDIGIGKSNETFFAEVHRAVSGRAQGFHGRDGHAHAGQKSHAAGLLKKPV